MNRLLNISVVGFCWASGVFFFGVLACIVGYLLYKGAGVIDLRLVFGDADPFHALLLKQRVFDGLFPAMVGTFLLVIISVSIAIPSGVAAGIYLAEYAGDNVKKTLGLFFDILAGVPSVVIGLFGFSASLFLHKHFSGDIRPCLLISTFSLAVLVLPYIIRTTQEALENIPAQRRMAAPAMGATRLQNIRYVLLPQSLPGIFSGVVLAVGRCAEDTAAIMLTGVAATAGVPRSLFSNYEALPFYIYYISSQYTDSHELATGYGASIILLFLCAVLFFFAFLIRKGLSYRAFCR